MCRHYTQSTHTSHARARDFFSRGSRLESSSQDSQCLSQHSHSSHLAQHVARAFVVVSFTLGHCLTFFPTCTPVRLSTRPSTRPLLIASSHGGFLRGGPSNVSLGTMAETHSLANHVLLLPAVEEPASSHTSTLRSASDKAKVGLLRCALQSSWRTSSLRSVFVA